MATGKKRTVSFWLVRHRLVFCSKSLFYQELLKQHEASLDSDGYTASDLLEVHLDGPASEEEVAQAVEYESSNAVPGVPNTVRKLQLTDFSRACLALWIERHGRRFRCYKKRSDTGATRGSSNLGTFEAAKRRQGEAIASLLKTEKPGSSVAFAGHKLQVYAQSSATSKDSLRKFGNLTKQKKEKKSVWQGSPAPMPPMRKSSVFSKPLWSPPPGCVVLNMTHHSFLTYGVAGRFTTLKHGVEKVQMEEIEKSHLVIVDSIASLEQMTAGPLDVSRPVDYCV